MVLVAKGHRLKRQDRFASLVHRLNLLFESGRGSSCSQLTIGIDQDWYGVALYRDPTNVGDKTTGGHVRTWGADTDDTVRRDDVAAGTATYGGVTEAGGV